MERPRLELDYQSFLRSFPDAIIAVGPSGRITYASGGVTRLLGWSPDELVGRPVTTLVPPRLHERQRRAFERSVDGHHQSVEHPLRMTALRRDGMELEVELTLETITTPEGEVIVGSLRDMSGPDCPQELRQAPDPLAILAGSPAPIVTFDPAGAVTSWNPAAERLLGWPASDVLGRRDPGVSSEARQRHESLLRRALHGETIQGVELTRVTEDGRRIDVVVSLTPLRDANGSPTGVIYVVTDTTGQRRVEGFLRESEDRFRSLNIGVLVFSSAGHFLACNPAALALLGRRRGELAGIEELRGVFVREDGSPCLLRETPVWQVTKSRQPVHDAVLGVIRPGIRDVRWVLVNAEPSFDERGNLARITCTLTDITARKRAEEALRASETRFRTIFDDAPVGIVLADVEGRIIQSNAALHAMLGFDEPELAGMSWADFTHPEDSPLETQLDSELLGGARDQYQIETRLIRKDGETVWARVTATEVRNEEGDPVFAIRMVEDISERHVFEEQLRHQALHDALTGLPNRTLLFDRLDYAIRGAQREGTEVALLLMDLNHFKDVNDTFGHQYGDNLLRRVARRLREAIRERDTVARLGGDEFGIVLPNTGLSGSLEAADKLIAALDAPFEIEGQRVGVGGSIGIALYPTHGAEPSSLLRRADVAMYVAKRTGTGRQLYELEHDEHSADRLRTVGELHGAVLHEQLVLHYQPIIPTNLDTWSTYEEGRPSHEGWGYEGRSLQVGGAIVAVDRERSARAEALVRWQHPTRGLIFPDDFVPLAERAGIIKSLTLWVINEALRQCRAWRDQALVLRVEVNLSARNLHDRDLPQQIERMLAAWELPGSALGLEITESAVMADPNRALTILERLRELGVSLAIDDFGTGYSSLAYLQRLPVDEIKIDRSFVSDMVSKESNSHIVEATIGLGHALGLAVVAEGVEDRATLDLLARMGCDFAQGSYASPALPPNELLAWTRV